MKDYILLKNCIQFIWGLPQMVVKHPVPIVVERRNFG